ncbi:SRPBCC family protein [Cohnella silvisoli]|uniref:SRPBCC domain-containing protein n=1 Tax=Cohnella silvisoli TaxID=2873699 RepID=A0ABV1KY14_9BACL|nr:SRPBCC domain-containing protein [Cohnella silvisoli]MCD9021888.1 SRPBCC domain-containing protein [Cohnella silvisoli]
MITMLGGKFSLKLNHVYNANKERVFHAWTKEELLKQWWGLVGFTTNIEQMDVSVGGKYRFHMRAPNGKIHTLEGRYVDIVPNEKLSFTWKWVSEGDDSEETVVTINFVDKDEKTELILTHSDFSTMKVTERHNKGWTNSLEGGLRNYFN